MKKFIIANGIVGGVSLLVPFIAFAQLTEVNDMATALDGIIKSLIPIAFGVALLFFFWGVAKFILAAGNAEAQAEGKRFLMWGVIALFIIASIWGVIWFIQDTFGVKGTISGDAPQII